MKVMVVGVYRDSTGWGKACCDYILALDSVGIEVVPRPLKLNTNRFPIPKRIEELEGRSATGCDAVIQHVLPHQMEYHAGCGKNIGLFFSETSNFRATPWPERLNLMDEVWVANHQQVEACDDSGVTPPVRVVPIPADMSRFQRSYEPLPELVEKLEGGFTFYTIGELVRRKNLPAVLRAFHLEFAPSEPVNLLIKGNLPNGTPEQSTAHIGGASEEVKRSLKLYAGNEHYHKEHVITQRFNDEAMMRLHATCDCFVSASFGEAWCLPAFDAMALGKTPIVPWSTGFLDYMTEDAGWFVGVTQEPVFGVYDSINELFTGRESWWVPSVRSLRKCMRAAFENRQSKAKAQAGLEQAYHFSYQQVGTRMRHFLES